MTKAELRQALKAKRANLAPEQITEKSRVIIEQLFETVDWAAVKSVHCYQSVGSEVDTARLQEILKQKGIAVTVPPKRTITQAELDGQFDLIIVPLLGFDDTLHRLGYGGGFYDRLLAAHPKVVTIGLAYDLSHTLTLPIEPHDQPLGAIITETKIYPTSFAYRRSQRV